MQRCKHKIRDLFYPSHYAAHATDTHDQAIDLARVLFVENSIHFLNHAIPTNFPQFQRYLKKYKAWIKKNNIDVNTVCIINDAVMAAYGLRDCENLGYLSFDDTLRVSVPHINNHNNTIDQSIATKDDIIFNPTNHFWYEGIKFASLPIVKAMKSKKNQSEDNTDIRVIDALLNKKEK